MLVDFAYVLGTLIHAHSYCLLISYMLKSRSCEGLSLTTQLMFMISYLCRYLDLIYSDLLTSTAVCKLIFILLSSTTVYLIYFKYYKTYESKHDSIILEPMMIGCLLLAVLTSRIYETIEIAWIFSRYLEAIAFIPQIIFTKKRACRDRIVKAYVMLLILYRLCYTLHYVQRFNYEGYFDIYISYPVTFELFTYLAFLTVYFSNPKFATPELPVFTISKILVLSNGIDDKVVHTFPPPPYSSYEEFAEKLDKVIDPPEESKSEKVEEKGEIVQGPPAIVEEQELLPKIIEKKVETV